jgi:trk system potassium uptake protein TrkA
MLSALVEEAVSIGDLVRLFTFRQGGANLVELTLPVGSPHIGDRVGDMVWPVDTTLVAILRDGRVIAPSPDDPLEAGDELLFVSSTEAEELLQELLSPHPPR